MQYAVLAATLASLASAVSAIGVVGTAEGFAASATGGGSATPVYPDTLDELVSYLGDDEARVIVLTKTFDFTDSEGTETSTGCLPWGTASGCQIAINQNDWCTNYEPDAATTTVTYDSAGVLGITVASDKSLIGEGSAGIIKGKGLRIVSGASNIIIQNIQISDINPRYVWGGDGITLDDTDLVWIDHVTTARIGRQHIVLGTEASGRVSITNHYLDGVSDYSATCDGHHYWGMYFTGSSDTVTLKDSYIYYTSGRAPKVQGNTLLHAVNNYFYDNSGHAFETADGAYVVAEGNVFQNVDAPIESGDAGQVYTSPSTSANTACADYLGHDCVMNSFGSSGDFASLGSTSFFSDFEGKTIADASSTSDVVSYVTSNAGMGKLSQ